MKESTFLDQMNGSVEASVSSVFEDQMGIDSFLAGINSQSLTEGEPTELIEEKPQKSTGKKPKKSTGKKSKKLIEERPPFKV